MSRLTVEQINIDWLRSAGLDELKSAMRSGNDVLSAVNALLNTPEGKQIANEMLNDPDYVPVSRRQPNPDEATQIAADEDRAAAAAVEAERQQQQEAQAAELAAAAAPTVDLEALAVKNAAEDAEARKIGATIVRNSSGEIDKIVLDYQVRNDEGRPVGRATHFEGRTWIEVLGKVVTAHANAVTYGERIKNNRFKQSQAAFESTERSAAATAARAESERLAAEAVNEKDPAKMQEAVKKAATAERDAQIAEQAIKAHGKIIAETWMADHKEDFYVCQASIDLMGAYMKANNLPMSYENLERTFAAVKHQLPPVPAEGQHGFATAVPTSAAVPTNTAPAAAAATVAQPASIPSTATAAPAPETQSAQPTVAPPAAASAPATTSATANQPTVARRPGVNGGLQPGSMSAARPSASTTQQTPQETRSQLLREIGKMDPAIYRKKLTTDKNFRDRLIAAGIPVAGYRA